jgi:predicted nuclease of predicted toxin-antitoxin system
LIAAGLRSAGHDATHIRDYNMQKATDPEVFAAPQKKIES